MKGIDLNQKIVYRIASLRFFYKNESHINRMCNDNVLLMVFDGVLRFSENGKEIEVSKGEYYIQEKNCYQKGYAPSDCPKYLFVHFDGSWSTGNQCLEQRGYFNIGEAEEKLKEMDFLAHGDFTYTQRCGKFYEILSFLYNKPKKLTTANEIARFIEKKAFFNVSLDEICKKFNFSKNHIINIFKKEYGVTPIAYMNKVKLNRAKYLLKVTSHTTEHIAQQSGFNDYSHFYKLFCSENKMPPVKWRRENQI